MPSFLYAKNLFVTKLNGVTITATMHGAIYSASFLSVISTPDCLMASPNDLTPSSRFNTSRKSHVSKVVKNSPEKAYTT